MLDKLFKYWKRIVLMVGAVGVISAAATAWEDVPTLFSDVRQIVTALVQGDSLPALHGQLALLTDLAKKERAKATPSWLILREYESRIRQIKKRISEVQHLSKRYRLR